MKIALACDHAGFILKEAVAKFLRDGGHDVVDFGTWSLDSVDYPDYLFPAAAAVAKGECSRGILVPGIAYAGAIVANKLPGVRAAGVEDLFAARICREHGDANILCLSGQTLGAGLAREIVKTFLETSFLGGKYAKRNDKVSQIELALFGKAPMPELSCAPKENPREKKQNMTEEKNEEDERPVLDLVTENDVRRALHSQTPLRAKQGALITPAARDLIEESGVRVDYV
jgi:ribose 5-phosphate isomerase B